MICVSTRHQAPAVPFRQALLSGLAPDGGLYVPENLDPLPDDWWNDQRGRSFQEVAIHLATAWFGDEFEPATIRRLILGALNFPVPIVALDDSLGVVELFHGPTFAFKDIGARLLARLMAEVQADSGGDLTVLVATSGDTGGAVAQAFFGVPGTRVVVLYPDGLVSPVQEAQFVTLGGNVTALAVEGTFDDCQRMVKEAFVDRSVTRRVKLTSANSISLGRLLPQTFYYAYASAQQPVRHRLTVSVPSGNFGNFVAGVLAWRLGAPIERFVAATTINDTVPRYLDTGQVEARPSIPTLANAMDVGNPSNLERLQWLFGNDVDAMRAMITTSVHTDAELREAISDLHLRFGYVADPHSAIGYLGAVSTLVTRGTRGTRRTLGTPGTPGTLFLATAHPAKFREVVEPAIGALVPIPTTLAEALARPRLATRIAPTTQAVLELL
ncbi:MAG: threonine synthase [Vicinamibacterales bacterium]